jgi:CubicO group peptidase (beta-lactamase class C family)
VDPPGDDQLPPPRAACALLTLIAACSSTTPLVHSPGTALASEQVFAEVDRGLPSPTRTAMPGLQPRSRRSTRRSRTSVQGLPGLAIGIVIDGELAHARGYGVGDLASQAAPDAGTVYASAR